VTRPIIALLVALLASARLSAQEAQSPPTAEQQPLPRARMRGGQGNAQQMLEQRVAQLVERQLQATPEQMQRLRETNRKYAERRRNLANAERNARQELRREILAGDRADQQHVDELIHDLISVQRQRLDLLDAEQRDLAAFLTPVQRAKYVAIQERLRNLAQKLRQRRQNRLAP
jgi:hypothetical protein